MAAGQPESVDDFIKPKTEVGTSDVIPTGGIIPYDEARQQGEVRSNLAYMLVWGLLLLIFSYALVGLVSAGCLTSQKCANVSNDMTVVRDFLGSALASITGLVGAVTGFYFGSKAAKGS